MGKPQPLSGTGELSAPLQAGDMGRSIILLFTAFSDGMLKG